VVALGQAGELARGAALYVTLEPCCHQGRTGPCTRAIVAAGVAQVHMAALDPNPLVNGGGKAELEGAGLLTSVGEKEAEARELMEAYLKWIGTGAPFVTAKYAMSLDGKIATASGDSRWITGEEARRYAHELRRVSDAIMVGINTVLRDDPQLTARDEQGLPLPRQPLRVVVDSAGRLPPTARLLREPGRTLLVGARVPSNRAHLLRQAGAEVLNLPSEDGRVDLAALLRELGNREVTALLAEGGGILLASLFEAGLVDKVAAFIAPLIIGGREATTPVEGQGVRRVAEAWRLERVRVLQLGEDVLFTGYPRRVGSTEA
jgi:diaminohydroxyphosphoribosylaminopyrimidine deaminase/5-amino-6-(5-phosphoribosylamino)uracil reductase